MRWRSRPAQHCPRSRRAGAETGLGESHCPRPGAYGGTARAAHRRELCVWPARSAAAAGRERTAGETGAGSGRGCSAAGAREEAPRQHPSPRCQHGSQGSSRARGRHRGSSGPGERAGRRGGSRAPAARRAHSARRGSGSARRRMPPGAVRRRAAVGARTHGQGYARPRRDVPGYRGREESWGQPRARQ